MGILLNCLLACLADIGAARPNVYWKIYFTATRALRKIGFIVAAMLLLLVESESSLTKCFFPRAMPRQ